MNFEVNYDTYKVAITENDCSAYSVWCEFVFNVRITTIYENSMFKDLKAFIDNIEIEIWKGQEMFCI